MYLFHYLVVEDNLQASVQILCYILYYAIVLVLFPLFGMLFYYSFYYYNSFENFNREIRYAVNFPVLAENQNHYLYLR